MKELSVFDVIGPKMIGPSSSHTAGALRIAAIAREFISSPVAKAEFTLYGSFAETYRGHGTDRALLGGILGYDTSDLRIRDSFAMAEEQGITYSFTTDKETLTDHANTVEVSLVGIGGETVRITGVSIGGGEVEIRALNGIEVEFRGEYCTLLVLHQDRPGMVAYMAQIISESNINIAFMKLFREGKGDLAYAILETDDTIPSAVSTSLLQHPDIHQAITVEGW